MTRRLTKLYIFGAAICSIVVLIIIAYFSYASPIVRLEHFYFLFGIIGSSATAITLYLLMVQYNQAQLEKIENDRLNQAKKISAWLDIDYQILDMHGLKLKSTNERIVVSNKSDVPVFNIVLSIVDGRDSRADGRATQKDFQRYIHTLPPGNGFIFAPQGYKGMNFVGAVEIGFEDSGNRSWVRHGNGSLKEVNEGTLKYYKLTLPLSYDIVRRVE